MRADIPRYTILRWQEVARRYGGVSRVTLWRWQNDPKSSFPKPYVLDEAGHKGWREDEIDQDIANRMCRDEEAA